MCCGNLLYTSSSRSHTPTPCAAGTLYIRLHTGHIRLAHVPREPYIYGFIPVTFTNPCAAGTLYIRPHPGHIHPTRVLREPYIYGFIPVTYTQPVFCGNLLYTASSRSHTPNPCAAGTLYIRLHPGHIHLTRVLREPYIYGFILPGHIHLTRVLHEPYIYGFIPVTYT